MALRIGGCTHANGAPARPAQVSISAARAALSCAQPSRAFSRRTNFCTFPVEVLGSSPNTTWRGSL